MSIAPASSSPNKEGTDIGEDATLAFTSWAAWGVIDIDDRSKFDRMQRRNYIKKVRAEMHEKGVALSCGGSTQTPFYCVQIGLQEDKPVYKDTFTAQGRDAFVKVCARVLEWCGVKHEG
jgi:hypothetical protein